MASVKNLLTDSLEDLGTAELKGFHWYLQNHGRIPASEMENADILDTVDMMVSYFGPDEAVKITVNILRKMNQDLLAEELKHKYNEAQTEGSKKAFSTPRANLTPVDVISDKRWMRMPSVREQLEISLEDLGTAELKGFHWYLQNYGHIPASEMENADVLHTVDMMVSYFGSEQAVKITVHILREMNQYLLAEELEDKHKEGSTLVDSTADLHHYTAEGGESHTCSSPKFSESKPSGLNIQPLLNCQSCVHIADSDPWVQIEPSACTDEEGSKFRVSTDPGRYECVRTRIRWVCDSNVTLQYRTVDGHFLNSELKRLQCHRIAPVMDVTVISGKLEEVHLPHYACLGESDPSLKDAVKLLIVKDEGITTEPVQLSRFHAKIVQPSFSIITLIISWILRLNEHCDLLLFMRSKAPLILHLYIFPVDESEKEKVEKNEKSSYPVMHPRPDRPFRMKTPHFLALPGATVHPKEGITFRRETPPNFFKVNTHLKNDLLMNLTREEDQKTVWTATIAKDELDQILPKRDEPLLNSEADKARYFDDHWPDLIQRVRNVQIIAAELLQQELIHEEQYSEIRQSLTSQESMRKICDVIRTHTDAVKAKLISVLQEEKLYPF